MIVVGLMSGTSADGVDAAVVELHGIPPYLEWQLLSYVHRPYSANLQQEIFRGFNINIANAELLCRLNFKLGEFFSDVALEVISKAGLTPVEVDLIGSHGQTFWHIPANEVDASTLQLGEPAIIAERTGVPVVSSFRARDMAAGGHGAPLVSYVDYLLLTDETKIIAAQNIGGIGNVTYLPPFRDGIGEPIAFDTGPGNMLIDYAAKRATNGLWKYDREGEIAARGKVNEALLANLMEEPYLKLKPPKTTGRELFGEQYGQRVWQQSEASGISADDIVATLTEFTARTIAQAYQQFLPTYPEKVIVHGGGARNPSLMKLLQEYLNPAQIFTSHDFGMPVDAKEAIAFAVLAYETWHRRPGNLPPSTGARKRVILGNITYCPVQSMAPGKTQFTELINPETTSIDILPTHTMLHLMNIEDHKPAEAVQAEIPHIANAVDAIYERMKEGGRLVYVGAGTAGRMGVLDASECPSTFNTSPGQVIGIMAGGISALIGPDKDAEDNHRAGEEEIANLGIGPLDSVVGISASGRTRFVLSALQEATRRGALTVGITCNRLTAVEEIVDISITPIVGPEVITGSTRLKSGTAQKLTLNMLSNGVMIRLGNTYGNFMVNLQPTNAKLVARIKGIVADACDISEEQAAEVMKACNGEPKTAIVHHLTKVNPELSRNALLESRGIVRKALEMIRNQ